MTHEYYNGVRWDHVLAILVPEPEYTGEYDSGNEAEYNGITWTDGRTKPTWAQILQAWFTGEGMDARINAPGDYKISDMADDHGAWLKVPYDGRTCLIVDYPILHAQLGTKYNSLYGGINASTHFGLPKYNASGFMRLPASGVAIGDQGGAANVTLTGSHLPQHDHDLNDNIVKTTGAATQLGLLGGALALAAVGSGEKTGAAGEASPTPVATIPPYTVFGNLFIYRGKGAGEDL